MQNLYWKKSDNTTSNLVSTPFESEEKLETYLFKHQDLLQDIFIFHRQIRTGHKQGIPDMLGVDQDGKVCLVELKNVPVAESILPQILQYAIWAETNPDSIRALWLEAKDRPEEIEVNWENMELRIIVVGPEYHSNVLRMTRRINYAIELHVLKRFVYEKDELILMDLLEEQAAPKIGITTAMGVYDAQFYEENHGKEPTANFMKTVQDIEALVAKNGQILEKKFNKRYIAFRYGTSNAFTVHWDGTKAWSVMFRVPEAFAAKFSSPHWNYLRYDAGWKVAIFRPVDPKAPKVSEIEPLISKAYEAQLGK